MREGRQRAEIGIDGGRDEIRNIMLLSNDSRANKIT